MHGSTTIDRSQTRPQSRHDSTVVDRQSHAFLHGSVVVDHHSKAITRFPQIHPKLRMKCWCLLRNGAAPLRRGADLLGMYVLHVTLTLTLLLMCLVVCFLRVPDSLFLRMSHTRCKLGVLDSLFLRMSHTRCRLGVLDSLKPTSIPKSHRQSTFLAFSTRGAIASHLTAVVEDGNGTLENGLP